MPRYSSDAREGLRLISVRQPGELNSERVILRASASLNLINYLVLDARRASERSVQDLNRNVFWFPAKEVEEGDYVRVYTRLGQPSSHDGTYGKVPARYHDFFWGRAESIWSGRAMAAVLVEIASWRMVAVDGAG